VRLDTKNITEAVMSSNSIGNVGNSNLASAFLNQLRELGRGVDGTKSDDAAAGGSSATQRGTQSMFDSSSFGRTGSSSPSSSTASTQPGEPMMPPNPDTDGDGKLSDSELQQMVKDIYSHTGQSVTVDELKKQLDTNGDGTITTAELQSHKPLGGDRR
jgi:hypothetical protein